MKYPKINKITKQYWLQQDFKDLHKTKTITEVFVIAVKIISRMPDNLAQVCGPITNGGKGSVEENLKYLHRAILNLQKNKVNIFDQIPFEETFARIINNKKYNQKYEDILLNFYQPLFLLGKIKTLYFVPGWESSVGARWEYEKGIELGMMIKML